MIVACLALGLVIAPFAPAAQAQSGNITLTLDRGQGANYAIGEAITINFTLPQPGFVRLVSITSVGAREIAAGPTPGTTGQIRSTVGQPAERHTLRMELLVNNQLVATGETFFNATTGNPNANQVGCNASVNGQLANTTDQDRWSFAGVSGQRVSATLNSTVPVQLTLQAPNGTVLTTGSGTIAETQLTQDGAYALIVGGGGQFGAQVVINYTLRLTCTQGAPPPPPGSVTYPTGWSLVGGPTGATFPVALFQYDPVAGQYKTVAANTAVTAGQGYWAYFTQSTAVTLSGISQTSVVISAPALQWVQVANPSTTQGAVVTGADAVYTWDPVANQYATNNSLRPGQGAWAIKYQGGSITVTVQ